MSNPGGRGRRPLHTEPPAWLMAREWPIDSREWKAKWAWEMRTEAGMRIVDIGEALGVSRAMAGELLTDPSGERARARKRKRHGICEDCGTRTFNSGSVEVPRRCRSCAHEHDRTKGAETKQRVAEQVREWTRLHGQPPRLKDWSPAHAALGYGGADRSRPDVAAAERNRAEGWPAPSTVMYHWAAGGVNGNWDDALEAIGVGAFQYAQRRKGVDAAEVVRLYVDEGLSQQATAERLGVTTGTVLYHLRKQGVAIRPPVTVDRDAVLRLYATGRLSQREVAARVGCCLLTANKIIVAAGAGPRSRKAIAA